MRFTATLLFAWTGVMAGGLVAEAAAAESVMFQSGSGRFEVSGEGTAVAAVNGMADEAWPLLATPLALPDAFSSPIYVRLVPAAEWTERAPFRVFVEAGGLVSMRMRSDASPSAWMIRRGLVQALLMRLAVSYHGVRASLTAPLWLEHAAVGWWASRLDAAQLDALKQETASLLPPSLAEIMGWQRGAAEPRAHAVGAVWLLTFLQAESGGNEWPGLLRRLLGGEEPLPALAAQFPGRFTSEAERELWWQTGWHHLRRAHGLPTLAAADSRAALAELSRFVLVADGEHDAVVPLPEVLAQAGEMWLDLELQRRAREVNRVLPALHPFYRNAGISLAAVLTGGAAPARREALCRAFENDWRDSVELDATTSAALDALERQRAAPGP